MKKRLIWNRDFLDWFNLTLAVLNLIFAINVKTSVRILFGFAAGLGFTMWYIADIFHRQQNLIKRSNDLSKKILDYNEKLLKELDNKTIPTKFRDSKGRFKKESERRNQDGNTTRKNCEKK